MNNDGNFNPSAFKDVCDYSVTNLIPPGDVVPSLASIPTREPFLVSRAEIRGRNEIDRFLSILAILYKQGRQQFEKVAAGIRGTKRAYFSQTPDGVYA